uniref:Ribonuclease H-like domain-containing protein n=1 Tax=Tanacetum cinerariifolium TaxID=118510 RepID=A0A6L2LZG0_TANCI|nr:ribonuclease H-like domain-containing protein [Tanacetum cinerariifolium]
MRIEQYFLMTDYSLWEVILNGDSLTPTRVIEGVVQHVAPTTAEQRLARKNELKYRGTLLMSLPDKHQLNFNIHKDAKTLMEAIKKKFGGNKETKKRNKIDLEEQSLDAFFNSLKIYEAKVKSSFFASTFIKKIAFVSSSNTDSTNEPVSAVASVSAISTKNLVSAFSNVDTLSNAVECYICYKKGHFARECMSPKDTRRNGAAEPQRRNVLVETSTSNALVSQCDGMGSYDWSFQVEEEPTNYALMAFTSSSSSSNNEVVSCFKACTKAYASLQSHYDKLTDDFRKSQFDVISYKTGLESVEARLLVYQQTKIVFEKDSKLLKLEIQLRDNALVVLRQNLKKEEQEKDDLKLKLEKFQTSSKNLSQLLASQTNDKTDLGYHTQVFTLSMFDCDEFFTSKSDESLPPSPIYDRYQSGDGYHAVPPPYTGTFMPPKPDLVFYDAPNVNKTAHTAFNVKLSPAKPDTNLSHTQRPSAPIIEDWVFDSKDDSEAKIPHNAPSFVQPIEQVNTPMSFIKTIETSIPTANPKTFISKPKSNGNPRNRKACFVCKSLDHLIRDCDFMKRKCYCSISKPHVTRLRQAKSINTKPHSPPRRHINRSLSPKASNFPLKVTGIKVPRVNVAKSVQGKWEWKPKCPILDHVSHNTRNMSYLSDFEELNGGYVAFGGNPKGGKIYRKVLGMKGINREFSIPRTPQQNGTAKRKNMTLIEAARTMLADSLLPIPFWAEAVNTVCYVQYRVLVTKPQNKTHYELLLGRTPSIGFVRPFGCHVTILNILDPLGKFDGKTINNQPVTAGNQSNPSAGVQEKFDAEKAGEENVQQYVFFPVWSFGSNNPKNTDGDVGFEVKEPEFEGRKPQSEVHVSPSNRYRNLSAKFEDFFANSINEVNAVDSPVLAVGQISTNSTNTFSAAGPSNVVVGPTDGKYSYMDTSQLPNDPNMPELEDITYSNDEEDVGAEADFTNLETTITEKKDERGIVVRNKGRLVAQGHTQEEGIDYEEVFALVARIEAIRLFLAYATFMGFMVYQMDVKSDFMYGTIKEEDKYVAKILRKFGLTDEKSASTPIDTEKPLLKDPDEGVDCLPNDEIFTVLSRMGYEKPSTKLTFYKAFFSQQWKFLIHTILQCMSAKRTSWNEFSSSIASAVICLSTDRKFNFSKTQVSDLSSHTTKYSSLALTQKVFSNIRRVGKGCSIVETPLFKGMIVAPQAGEGAVEGNVDDVPTTRVAIKGAASVNVDDVPAAVDEPSIPSPTPPTQLPLPSLDIPSTSQVQPTPPPSLIAQPPSPQQQPQPLQDADISMDFLHNLLDTCTTLTRRVKNLEQENIAQDLKITKLALHKGLTHLMDDISKQRRIIVDMDADVDVTLKDTAKDVVVDAEIKENADVQGRQVESKAQIYKIDIEHANKVLSMQDDDIEPDELQKVVEVVTTAKLITEVVTAASATITDVALQLTTAAAPILTTAPSTARRRKGRKRIMVHELKPFKKKTQIEQDEAYARELEAELNKNINWDKPKIEAQARKKMMIYLRNIAGFKIDYFKGMKYNDIHAIFDKYFNSNVAFLEKTKEQMEEEDIRALKRISETQEEKIAKKKKLDEEMILLVERRYPLTRFTLDQMLNNIRLEVEEKSEVSLELLRFIRQQNKKDSSQSSVWIHPPRSRQRSI